MQRLAPLVLALLTGCSLILDFDESGLPCDGAGACKEGYTCDGENLCMPEGSETTLCKPACSGLEVCFKAKCEPVCKTKAGDVKACPAGQFCNATETSECEAVKGSNKPNGLACSTDADCNGATQQYCLRPYGGGTGFCTKTCASEADCSAGQFAKCREYPGARDKVKICAPESFKPCVSEADCVDSKLSCGAYAFVLPKTVALQACRAKNGSASIGDSCTTATKCANGLCVKASGASAYCATPCTTKAQCEVTAPQAQKEAANCAEITLTPLGDEPLPNVRMGLCMTGAPSIAEVCVSAGDCRADGPACVTPVGGSAKKCAPICGKDAAERCPGGTSCKAADGEPSSEYCL